MSDTIKINLEKILFGLTVLIALAIRLFGLGDLPLSDAESSLALQSLDLARGVGGGVQADPAYVLMTGALFFLTQANEFTARFWPAILGGLIPLVAFWLRGVLGKRPALFLAFGLALDPGLVALSRQADGAGLTVVFVLAAGAFALSGRSLLTGIFAGLAVLGGEAFWPGLIGVGFVLILARKNITVVLSSDDEIKLDWKQISYGVLAVLLVVGTLLMTAPSGLGGIGSGLGTYLQGWGGGLGTGLSSASLSKLLVALLVYHSFPLVFGLVAIIRSSFDSQDHLGRILAAWFGLALILCAVYPSRQVTDLVWCLIPLWSLTARELSRINFAQAEHARVEAGYALLVVIMIVFLSWSTVSIPGPAEYAIDADRQNGLYRLLAGFVLFLLTFGLVVWGWGLAIAAKGLRFGMAILLSFWMVSATWNAAGLAGAPETEMWRIGGLPKEAGLMRTTLDDLSMWNHNSPNRLDVAVVGIESPGLRWLLRDYPEVRFLGSIAVEDSPSVVITPSLTLLAQASAYRGQDFVWSSVPAWSLLSPYDLVQWAGFREAVMENQFLIVWVRNDQFPGAVTEP